MQFKRGRFLVPFFIYILLHNIIYEPCSYEPFTYIEELVNVRKRTYTKCCKLKENISCSCWRKLYIWRLQIMQSVSLVSGSHGGQRAMCNLPSFRCKGNEMKKSLIALSILALSGAAFAHGNPPPAPATSATSTVNGSTVSAAVATGVNQFSVQGASAYSQNQSSTSGSAVFPGFGLATSGATTQGTTVTSSGGLGQGFSGAAAEQYGNASSTQAASGSFNHGKLVGNINASSNATTGTHSNAATVNTGLASSGSTGSATNNSSAMVTPSISSLFGNAATQAVGNTAGVANVTTWGAATPGGVVNAGGTLTVNNVPNVGAVQSGTYGGSITIKK